MYAIAVFGDSLTFGRGNNIDRGWCGRLRRYFEEKDYYNAVYNLGIPGNTSTSLLERIGGECEHRLKKIREGDKMAIVVAIGLNDSRFIGSRPETTLETFEKNINEIATIAKKYGDEVAFIGITPVNEELAKNYEGTIFSNDRVEEFNSILQAICKKNELQFIDVFSVLIEENLKEILGDGVHPNEKGYTIMFEKIQSELKL